jgi:hypothetical protein
MKKKCLSQLGKSFDLGAMVGFDFEAFLFFCLVERNFKNFSD